jgi:cytochrome c-type biogenesis protein CcmH/NrfG
MMYHEPGYLLTTDLTTPAAVLIQAYLDRWQIEVAHRDEKTVMGVGQAQVRNARSVMRQPAFAVAAYALLLLAGLKAYGAERTSDLPALPRWRGQAGRPSCLDLLTTLRRQLAAGPHHLDEWDCIFDLPHAVDHAAA